MGKFLVRAAATVALNVFAPLAHAQDYVVNGHAASKAEAVLLTSYSARQATGRSMASVVDEQPAPPAAQAGGPKCWYVLDVKLCN